MTIKFLAMRNEYRRKFPTAQYSLNRSNRVILFSLLIVIAFGGCRSAKIVNSTTLKLKQDFCVSALKEDYSLLPAIMINTDSLLNSEKELSRFLTKQNILAANATGTLKLIKDMISLGIDTSKLNQDLFIEYTIEIGKNIALVKSEMEAVSSELECETFRTRQLSAYLSTLNAKRNSKLTVGAIAVGSLTSAVPTFVPATTPQTIITIAGGLISAGLGALTLKSAGFQLRLMTYRNLLANIWHGDTVNIVYPPGLWYYLNEPGFGNSQGLSKAKITKMRWLKFDLNNSLNKSTENLLFGDGGVFSQSTLDLRATMLSELAVEVNSMNQHLDNLYYAVSNIKLYVLNFSN